MEVVAAASRLSAYGHVRFFVFDRYFAMFCCIRISFSIAHTVLSPESFYLIALLLFGVASRERCVFPLKFFCCVLRPFWNISCSLGTVVCSLLGCFY